MNKSKIRSPKHLDFIRKQVCSAVGCDATPCEAAHVRVGTGGGMGMKPSDQWVIPLCSAHHRTQHSMGEVLFAHGFLRKTMRAIAKEWARKSPDEKIRETTNG